MAKTKQTYLSANIKWLLKQHNLTMAELARRCNIVGPVLFRIAVGQIKNPQVNTLLPIADYFNCSLENLLAYNLAKNPEKLNIKTEVIEIRHQMRNAIAVINTVMQGTQKILPTLLECYHLLPEDLRPRTLSPEVLRLLPRLLENGVKTVSDLKKDINQLKERMDEI